MGSEQVLDNLTFKRMTTLRKQIQSVLVDYFFKLLFLDTCSLKQIQKRLKLL